MCLGIPMRIIAIDGDRARCEAGGIEREVSLFMLRPDLPVIGDFVLVHVGCAIQTVRPGEARTAWELHDAMQQRR
ncbi:MAG: HypC/HybG/HupF family hydrogenase formation chaperone [Gammaproteobacteria bacterium]|nr:HypC/HybG/HupF family hydrogenase formation chaperone [Gammaproteobacteria bacterium]